MPYWNIYVIIFYRSETSFLVREKRVVINERVKEKFVGDPDVGKFINIFVYVIPGINSHFDI